MAKKEKKKRSFWEGFFVKLPWIIAFSVFFMILSLKSMERFPGPLKEGFENYFSTLSGQQASIGTLKKSQFFPSLYIEIEDLLLSDAHNVALQSLSVQNVKVQIPFVSMFIGGRDFYDVEMNAVESKAGVLTDQSLSIEVLDIIDDTASSNKAMISANGTYADRPMSLEVDLERSKTLFGSIVYRIPKEGHIRVSIGDVALKSRVVTKGADMLLQDGMLEVQGKSKVLRDSSLVQNRAFHKDNIISCLLAQDYKNVNNICLDYVLDADIRD